MGNLHFPGLCRFGGLLIFLTVLCGRLSGQELQRLGIAPSTALENCSVDQWTGENGLLSNNLTSVMQASSGFLWITTNNGLMRFDGVRLEIFDQAVIPFLSTEAFYRMYEDKHKTLWFATRGNGILTYSENKFRQFLPGNPLVPKSLRTMLVQDDGTIWAGSDYKGLIRIKDSVATRIEDPLLENISILTLEESPEGTIYIGTNSRGLLAYDHGKIRQVPINNSTNHTVQVIKCLTNGKVYVGTTYGLFVLHNNEWQPIELLDNIQVNHIIVDQFESIWVATERGLARINEKLGIEEFLRSGKSFSGAHITSLCLDKEGSLWMSTGKSGLLRLKESLIRSYSERHGLAIDRVNVISEGPDGRFYVCLDDGLVNVFDNGTIRPFPIELKAWNESVRDILIEDDGTCWLASYNGVLKKTRMKEKLFTTEDGLSSNSVRRIFRDKQGTLWFGTRTGGVIRFAEDKVSEIYNREKGLSSDYILSIEQDKEERLLIGTHSGGLNVINKDGSIEVFHIKDDDDGVLIFNVSPDDQGQVWLATSVGLYNFNFQSKVFRRIALREVVKGESYFDWVEDRMGNVWVTTNIGILQMSKDEVLSFLEGETEDVQGRIFNDYDGMKNKECTGATRSMLSAAGEVWVPTIEGVCVIDPSRQKENKIVPPVYITEVVTDNETLTNPYPSIKVAPGNFRITLHFTSLSLLAPNKVKFKYKLDLIDKEWKTADPGQRSVGYTNLSPGKYTFSVIASNSDGVWNEEGTKLFLEVRPYFYETAWFYLFMMVFLLAMFFLIYRWRVNAVENKNAELIKVNSELDRFVYSASHDLRAPLASILGLVRLTKLDEDPQNRIQYLEMVEKSIHKLDGFIHDIINYSRNARTELQPTRVNFNAMLNEILETLKYQEKSNRIRKEVKVSGSDVFYTDIKRLDIVLFNLVTNAIKYHNVKQEDPFILIDVTCSEKMATITVTDNGIGIDKKHLASIFKMFYRADERSSGSGLGLFIARETVEKLKGTLEVDSEVGRGTTFTIQIPSLENLQAKAQASVS